MFAIALLVVNMWLWVKFVARFTSAKKLVGELNIDQKLATLSVAGSVGFIVAAVVGAIPLPIFRILVTPVPIVVLLCLPGIYFLSKLSNKLERSGTSLATPAIEWAQRGTLAGWLSIGTCLLSWVFAIAPTFLGSVTTSP